MFCCANAKDHQIPKHERFAMCMKVHGKRLERDVKSKIPRQEYSCAKESLNGWTDRRNKKKVNTKTKCPLVNW